MLYLQIKMTTCAAHVAADLLLPFGGAKKVVLCLNTTRLF